MNFELELPYADDTVYLAYSRPYPYSQIIAHMFDIENRVSKLPGFKNTIIQNSDKKKGSTKFFTKKITRNSIVYTRQLLCKTICGLPVPKIMITGNNSSKSTSSL